MKHFILILYLLCVYVKEQKCNFMNGSDNVARVIDGINARLGQFPFMASIMRKSEFGQKCGGSVLNRWFVLTACHCVAKIQQEHRELFELSWLFVVAGHVNRLPGHGGQVRFVDAAIVHENCTKIFPGATFDIALIKITHPFRFNPFLKPMPIYSRNETVLRERVNYLMRINAECFGIGWGMTKAVDFKTYEKPSDLLLYAKVRIMELSDCRSLTSKELNNRKQLCALGSENSDVCKADSGGPLYCLGHVYGLVSWGPFCGELNLSTMYQRLDTDLRFVSCSHQTTFSFILFLLTNKIPQMFFL